MAIKKRGDKYLAVLFIGYSAEGKRIEHSKTFRLKKEAERYERDQRALLERNEWVQPTSLTLGQYLEQWEHGALALGKQRMRTKAGYVWLLNAYVVPRLGRLRLSQITRPIVQRLAAELLSQKKGSESCPECEPNEERSTLSPITVRRALAALSVALNSAVEDRLLVSNPAQRISLPQAARREIRWLTRDEIHRLIAGTASDRHGPLWTLLAHTGMRPSEALGLTWDNVDIENRVIRVQQSLTPLKRNAAESWRLDEPKTRRSRRAVPLPEEAVRSLRALRGRQAAERLAAGDKYSLVEGNGFVFARPDGQPYRQDSLLQLFHRTLRRLGLPRVSLYSLRHGHASWLLEAGVPLKIVSERLGHSSIQLTADTYSHVSDELQRKAIEQFESYMEGRTNGVQGA